MSGRPWIVGLSVAAVVVLVVVLRLTKPGEVASTIGTDVTVHVAEISRATLNREVTVYGTVDPAPALDGRPAAGSLLTPFVGGVVLEVRAVEGRKVQLGTVLFRLDSRRTDVAVQSAHARVDFAEKAFGRQEQLLTSDGTSQRAYEEARVALATARAELAAAETDLAYLNITAPLTGTVTRLGAEVGQFVDTNTVLAQVVDLDRLVVTAGVPSREIEGIVRGGRALIGPDAAAPEGRILVLSKSVDPATGAYRVQVAIPAGTGFTPGQFTEVRLVSEERPDVLVVPEESLVSDLDGASWVVIVDGDYATRVSVSVGLRDDGLVEVSGDGLTVGTKVVTTEAYSLPERTKVRVIGS